ncbi:MAG: hypothetical protein LBK42_07630 [Propionibacteriaceae bacterium]|nr:hypothetical protein [Propionibacteriaceae bacterium]
MGEVAFTRDLLASKDIELGREALALGWAGWHLQDVDYMRFDTIILDEYDEGMSTAHEESGEPAKEGAWMALMYMVGYVGYYYCQTRGILCVPQSIGNVPAVDVLKYFNESFDQAVPAAASAKGEFVLALARVGEDGLTRESVIDLVGQIFSESSPESQ